MILLDTSFCVDWFRENSRGREGSAASKLRSLGTQAIGLPIFALCELEAGARASSRPDVELLKIRRFAAHTAIIMPSSGFASLYAEALWSLKVGGTMIPLMDLLIGLCAKQEDSVILTRDVEHFRRIEGLSVETW